MTNPGDSNNKAGNQQWLRYVVYGFLAVALVLALIPRFMRARTVRSPNACINNLRQLDGAKAQWALENKKADSDVVTLKDVLPYLKGGTIAECEHYQPEFYKHSGTYGVTTVGANPTCKCPGHTL